MIQKPCKSSQKKLSEASFSKRERQKVTFKEVRSLAVIGALYAGFFLMVFWIARWGLMHYGHLFFEVGAVNKLAGEEAKVASYVASVLQASLIVPSTVLYLTDRIKLSTWRKLSGISIGYFCADLLVMTLFRTNLRDFLQFSIHHLVLLFVLIFYFKIWPKLIAQGLLAELTLPFLYTCKFLAKIEQTDNMFYFVMAGMTLLTWSVLRVINFSYIYYQLYKRGAFFVEYAIFAPVVLMNYYWFVLLLQKAFM